MFPDPLAPSFGAGAMFEGQFHHFHPENKEGSLNNKFSLKIFSQNTVEFLSVSNLNYRSASLKFLSPLNCPMTRAGGGSGKMASHL
jgi:hypothetical protein